MSYTVLSKRHEEISIKLRGTINLMIILCLLETGMKKWTILRKRNTHSFSGCAEFLAQEVLLVPRKLWQTGMFLSKAATASSKLHKTTPLKEFYITVAPSEDFFFFLSLFCSSGNPSSDIKIDLNFQKQLEGN